MDYGTRQMVAADADGYFDMPDTTMARALVGVGTAEYAPEAEPKAAAKRGRPPAAAATATAESEPEAGSDEPLTLEDYTRDELLAMAAEHSIELPSGYVAKDKLVDLLRERGIEPA
jgi:hypothetical protein